MKKLAIIAIALVTLQATAQDQKNDNRRDRMHNMQDFTPEEMAQLKTKRMTLHLDLTKAQQVKVQKINLENAIARKAKMEVMRAKRETRKGEDGVREKRSKEERLKMMNDKLDKLIAEKQKMKSILNETQYKKWEKTQNPDRRMRGDKKHGRKGQGKHRNHDIGKSKSMDKK